MLDCPLRSIDEQNLQVSISDKVKSLDLLALVDEHLSIGEDMFFECGHEGSDHHLRGFSEDGRLHQCVEFLLEVILR